MPEEKPIDKQTEIRHKAYHQQFHKDIDDGILIWDKDEKIWVRKEKIKLDKCEHNWTLSGTDNLNYYNPIALIICIKCGEVKRKTIK